MTILKKVFFRVKMFLGIRKVSSFLLGFYRGEINKPYVLAYKQILEKAEESVLKRKGILPTPKPKLETAFEKKFRRVKEIILKVEKRDFIKDEERAKEELVAKQLLKDKYIESIKQSKKQFK